MPRPNKLGTAHLYRRGRRDLAIVQTMISPRLATWVVTRAEREGRSVSGFLRHLLQELRETGAAER